MGSEKGSVAMERQVAFHSKTTDAVRKILLHALVAVAGAGGFALDSQAQTTKQGIKEVSVERDDASICVELAQLAERTRRFPKGLLYAIARVESGRTGVAGGLSTPWPWTVTAKGEGRYYESKQQAVRAVEQMQRDGQENIDVGCMQVNLYHHGRAFRTVAEVIDPVNNVAYATEYLVVLYKRYNNWEEAIKHYHSSDPTKHDYYLSRVKRAWEQARAPRSDSSLRRAKKEKKGNAPVLSSEEAGKLEREVLLFSDELRKKLGTTFTPTERSAERDEEEERVQEATPGNAQNLNAGFFLDLIDKPL